MLDRVPLYPGRIKLVPVPGQENTYDMTRADQPTQEGNPLNKNTLYKDLTAALYGFGPDSVPDDALAYLGKYAQHWWRRYKVVYSQTLKSVSTTPLLCGRNNTSEANSIQYGDLSISQSDGSLSLTEVKSLSVSYLADWDSILSAIKGKYITKFYKDEPSQGMTKSSICYVPNNATFEKDSSVGVFLRNCSVVGSERSTDFSSFDYVQSSLSSTYPESGEKDGYYYQYIGVPFENLPTGVKIATGSYVGTGTYGESNPNSLTFEFLPRQVYIHYGIDPLGPCYTYSYFPSFTYTSDYIDKAFIQLDGDGTSTSADDRFAKLDGVTMSWYSKNASAQMNYKDVAYRYIAIG